MNICRIFLVVVLSTGLIGKAVADLNDGLVAFYPFNGNAEDESGNGNDGIVYEAILTGDRFGNSDSAYYFDGVDDVLKINNMTTPKTEITLSIWFNLESYETNGETTLFDKHGGFFLHVENDKIRFYLAGIGSLYSSTIPTLNSWNHIVATYDGSTQKIYLNNSLVAEDIATGSILSSSYPLYIASDESGIYHYMNGSIDDARIYNRVLRETEIQELSNYGPSTKFVGGFVTGISNGISIICKNLTTGESVKIILNGDTAWNCDESGFVVNQGDVVVQTVKGKTEVFPLEKLFEENPLPGSLLNTRLVEYRWYASTDAVKYKINLVKDGWNYIYTKTIDANKVCESDLCKINPNNFYLPNTGEMTWRVIAIDSNGKNIAQSDRITFFVNNDPLIQPLPSNAQGQMKGRVMGHCLFGGSCARSSKTKSHNATDYMVPAGTTVYAICKGKVKEAITSGEVWERFTNIDHSGNCGFNKLFAYYGHIDPIVEKDDPIKPGQKIGEVATWKDNSHLHLAISQDKYHTSEWGYVDVGVKTNNSCKKNPVNKRIQSLSDKGWADAANVGYMGGWNLFNLKGGKSGGDCNVKKSQEYKPYPYGSSLPYSPWSK